MARDLFVTIDSTGLFFSQRRAACRFGGEVVAAVAAETLYKAWDATRAIRVTSDVLSFVFDAAKAAEALVRNAQPLQHNAYKVPLFRGMLGEELTAISKT